MDLNLTDEELNDLNVIIHQKEWPSALKLFRIFAENKASEMKTNEMSNDKLRETLGEFKAYSRISTLLFDIYNGHKKPTGGNGV